MKFIPQQDYREKIETLKRLVAAVSARKRPFELSPLTDEQRERIEAVTRFEQFRGLVYKQLGNRQREMLPPRRS